MIVTITWLLKNEIVIVTYQMLKESLSDYKNPDNKIKRMSDGGEIVRLTKNLYETNVNTPGPFGCGYHLFAILFII